MGLAQMTFKIQRFNKSWSSNGIFKGCEFSDVIALDMFLQAYFPRA